jgi:hypothetical protein
MRMKNHQTVIEVNTFDVFTNIIDQMEHRYWVFRGHGKYGWHIESTLARYFRSHAGNIQSGSHYPREADAIRKFRRSAHLHLSHLPEDNDLLNWLAVMQHFGAPTRLIDFTHSPYVALFFAVEGATPRIDFEEKLDDEEINKRYGPYEVHAVHLKSVLSYAGEILGDDKTEDRKYFKIGEGKAQTKEFVEFFEGIWQNQRQVAQQGLFLVPSKIDLDIDEFLKNCPSESQSYPDTSWFIFRFPGGLSNYYEMVTRLLRANVTAEALFPGLDGIARSISMRYYEPRTRLR